MQAILDRIMQEKWECFQWINPKADSPFLFIIECKATGRGKTMEGAMIEAIRKMDNVHRCTN